MGGNKVSASWVSQKLVKSNERGEREKERKRERAKASVDNGQYIRLNQLSVFWAQIGSNYHSGAMGAMHCGICL